MKVTEEERERDRERDSERGSHRDGELSESNTDSKNNDCYSTFPELFRP